MHISLFPAEERPPLEFQFLLSSCLDIFEARLPFKTADQDFGLLQAVDERLAMYGWLTNTGVKIVIVVDMEGRPATALDSKAATAVGLRDADLKPVSLPDNHNLPMLIHSGFPSIANSIHQATQESILQPRRALSGHSECRTEDRVNANHQQKFYSRSKADSRSMGPRRHQHMRSHHHRHDTRKSGYHSMKRRWVFMTTAIEASANEFQHTFSTLDSFHDNPSRSRLSDRTR